MEFIRRLNATEGGYKYRLPTEAEWEYSCRAFNDAARRDQGLRELGCGIDPVLDKSSWYCGNSSSTIHPVAQKQPNAWGLYDMHGNVYEWCQDWYAEYPRGCVRDYAGPSSGFYRVFRGGGWRSSAHYCRAADRGSSSSNDRNYAIGFRLARTP